MWPPGLAEAPLFPIVYRRPIPLTAEEAWWHACSGEPWEQQYEPPVPVMWDRDMVGAREYRINAGKLAVATNGRTFEAVVMDRRTKN